MKKGNERNSAIDTLRLIAAFLVVYIHSGIFGLGGTTGEIGNFILAFARFAVPFFFVVSGYFLYSDSYGTQIHKAKKSIAKLINIFLLSSLLYFIFYGWYFGSYEFTFNLMNPSTIVDMLLFNRPFYNEALWFLLALIGATGIHLLNAKYIKKDILILIFAIFFYVLGLIVGGNYGQATGTSSLEIMYTRNFLGYALLFTTIGYFSHKYKARIANISWTSIAKLLLIALALYLVEFYVIKQHVDNPRDIYFMTPAVVCLVFMTCIKMPHAFSKTILPILGAQLSLYIYILHIGILYTLGLVFEHLSLDMKSPYIAASRIILTFLISLLIGAAYLYTKKFIKRARVLNRIKLIYNR